MALVGLTSSLGASPNPTDIAVIHKGSHLEFWDLMAEGVDEAALESKYKVSWIGSEYVDNTPSQIKLVKKAVKEGARAIVLVPTDARALSPVVKEISEKGIKVVVVDSGIAGHHHKSFVGSDNFAGGAMAAQRLAENLGGVGDVAVIRIAKGSASTDKRGAGFVQKITRSFPGIDIVADIHTGGLAGSTYRAVSILLKKHPNLKGLFAVNESSTEGTLKALRGAGKAGVISLVGYDSNSFLEKAVRLGEIDSLIIQNPKEMGYLGVKFACDLLVGLPVPTQSFTAVRLLDDKTLPAISQEN